MLKNSVASLAIMIAVKNKPERSAITKTLKKRPGTTRTMSCATAKKARHLLENEGPFQIAVIDHALKDSDGLKLCKHLLEAKIDSRLLFLTAPGNESAAATALTAGVDAVVLMDNDQGYLNLLPAVIENLSTTQTGPEASSPDQNHLHEQRINTLREANLSLKKLLANRSRDKRALEDKIGANIQRLVMPYIQKLIKTDLDDSQSLYLNLIHDNLLEIVEPFLNRLTSRHPDLTATETRIAWLIREGKTTPEIARILSSSKGAVNFHRNNIRKKTGLRNRKINLQTYLLTLS